MKRTFLCLLLCVCLVLGGCAGLFDGHYESVKPHEQQSGNDQSGEIVAQNYEQLRKALENLVEAGTEESVISVADYEKEELRGDMRRAVDAVCNNHPVAAYAVKKIDYDVGTRGGMAVAVSIEYLHDRTEIMKISQVENVEQAADAISGALNRCDVSIVLEINDYEDTDFVQLVENYAWEHPELVMELPQVTVAVFPERGTSRVVEMKFRYRTSRESLKNMQDQVQPVFDSAALYVSGDAEDGEKYSQLCSFLMERYDYQYDTSITPAYSLLRHGVGDSRAFAAVYAAMCHQAGLECIVVCGTYEGESRYWNIICDEGVYYHIDLLSTGYRKRKDKSMEGYVWDYSAYPVCNGE